MASLLIKNLPDKIHQRLKAQAERHHRSLNKEVITLLETAVIQAPEETLPEPEPEPVPLKRPLNPELLDWARREGRS